MNIKELQDEAKKDLEPVDINSIVSVSLNTPTLQGKYIRYMMNENMNLEKASNEYDELYRKKWIEYKEDFQHDLNTKEKMSGIINGDKEIIEIKKKISRSKIIINFLEETIKTLQQRSFHVKNAIEWQKFTHGEQ